MDFADVPADVRRTVERYLGVADRLLPDRITGFYLVGSVALDAYRPGRSDIDFVAVLDGDGDPSAACVWSTSRRACALVPPPCAGATSACRAPATGSSCGRPTCRGR